MQKEPIRILIVDDHALVKEELKKLLETSADMSVVSTAGDAEEALVLFKKFKPDIVLMDLSMPGTGGIGATRSIRALDPAARILFLSMHDHPDRVDQALRSGASGYLLKETPSSFLKHAIRTLNSGTCEQQPILSAGIEPLHVDGLTRSEPSGCSPLSAAHQSRSTLSNKDH